MEVQEALGAEIVMAFDECPPHPCPADDLRRAVDRTVKWAERCAEYQARRDDAGGQALFGITQGGLNPDLRRECAAALSEFDFPGYALGGLSVGEPHDAMVELLGHSVKDLPADRPRCLMGVG